jgi:hypothetical protein
MQGHSNLQKGWQLPIFLSLNFQSKITKYLQ